MNKEELLELLRSLKGADEEAEHSSADIALLEYIDDKEISEAFDNVKKWYA